MKILVTRNNLAHAKEHGYNLPRLAGLLAKRTSEQMRAFLIGEASAGAKRNEKLAAGCKNLESCMASSQSVGRSAFATCAPTAGRPQ